MGSLLSLLAQPKGRVAVANNCNLPISFNTGSNWVQNCWTAHRSGPAGYTAIEVTFVNGLISTNSESNAYYDFYLRAGLCLNGQFYQFLFDGQPEVLVSKSWGVVHGRVNVYIPPNTTFYVTNRRVASDNGTAGSYNVITNTGGVTARQDGILSGTDTAQDYTLGAGVAFGAANNRVTSAQVNGSGVVTGVTRLSGGQNYGGGLVIASWYGPAGAGAPGALIPGSGITGFGNSSGGLYTTTSITSGGSGHSTSNPPYIFVGGTPSISSGFGSSSATYGPSLITGIPRTRTPSVIIHGDSIVAGYGSVDSTGDLNGSHGWYEQLLANRYGVHKLAVSGEQAAGWIGNNTHQLAFIDDARQRGLRPTHVVIALGVNDFLTNTNTNVLTAVQGYVSQIATAWRSRGAKVLMTTIPPNNTTSASSNKYSTIVEQTPFNVNYTAGSYVDQYNAALLNNTGPANDGVIDGGSLMRDATTTTAWRVDCYGGATAFCATDGTHPSVQVGIPFLIANMSLPSLA